ncbi:MAG: TIM-barrel domain-containing protein [Muricoprocola sp.]
MKDYYKVKTSPKCREASVVKGEKYRITVLTEGLLRLEYSESGKFVDEATQTVWNRDFETPEYLVKDEDGQLEIITSRLHLIYNKKKFSSHGLSIKGQTRLAWYYGEEKDNLGGTVRTLDEVDGACPLENGIMSKSGYALLDDSKALLIGEDSWIKVREEAEEDLYFFCYGRDYRQALKDYYHLCGRTPMIPRFALGNWWSRYYPYSEKTYLELMDRFKEEQIPFTVGVIDMDWHVTEVDPKYGDGWTGYTWNRKLFPDPERFLKELHKRGMRITLNVHPADGVQAYEDMYEEMADAMGVDKTKKLPVNFDISDKKFLEKYFEILHHPYEKMGVDFWWIDWQQGGNTKVEGLDPLWMLNHFHYLDSGRTGKRPMVFSRYAGPGSHRYPIGFSGDTIVTWESLQFQPYFTATASNIGYGWWSHDIGGHMFGYRDDEMEARWYQLGVFSPIMRLHSTQNEFLGKEPWRFPAEIQQVMNDFLRLRHRLIPYLYTMNYRSYAEGEPLVEPLYYLYSDAEEAYNVKNGFFFGTELLAFPVTTPRIPKLHVAKTKGWLPAGTFIDIFNGMIYQSDKERKVDFHRDITSLPVLAKAGAIVPMTDEILGNAASKNPGSLRIKVFAGADGSFHLYEDDNETCGYETGHCTVTPMKFIWGDKPEFQVGAVTGEHELIPEKRDLTLEFWGITKSQIKVLEGVKEVPCETSYDNEKNVLIVQVERHAASETLMVQFTEKTMLGENHVEQRVLDFLQQAEISFTLKEKIIASVRRQSDPVLMAGELCSNDLNPELAGVLMEILTAKKN